MEIGRKMTAVFAGIDQNAAFFVNLLLVITNPSEQRSLPLKSKTMKNIVFLLLFFPLLASAQRDWSAMTVSTSEMAPGIFRLFVGENVAVTAYAGEDGVLLIDAAYEQTAPQLMSAVRELSSAPLRYIVNTHIHGDHTGGNLSLGEGVDIIAHQAVKDFLGNDRTQGDRVIPAFPEYARPNISFSSDLELEFNGQTLRMIHLPGGHTNSDIIIHFPASNVLVVGDLLFADRFPYVDVGNGGHPFKYLENLHWIIDNYPDDVTIIGGHGPVYSMKQLSDWRLSLQQTVEAVKTAKERGLTAGEMKDERILEEWEEMGLFFISEDRWIDTLFPFL